MQKASWLSTGMGGSPLSEHVEGKWSVIPTAKLFCQPSTWLLPKVLSHLYARKLLFMKAARARPSSFISDNPFPLISQCFE